MANIQIFDLPSDRIRLLVIRRISYPFLDFGGEAWAEF